MLREKLDHFNTLLIAGERLKAIELFYAEKVQVKENEDLVTVGKQAYLFREKNELEKYHLSIEITRQAIDDINQVAFSEYIRIYTDNQGQQVSCRREISIQQWNSGLIQREDFFYHRSFQGAGTTDLLLIQFPLQIQKTPAVPSKLKARDIESLHHTRDYLAFNFEKHNSISELAKQAGMNRMKLKNGFKELFGTTIFTYLADIRMAEAKRLLVEEKARVAEVAERIGYKHPHHFTAAFKKKFGLLPTDLRNNTSLIA